jgi:DNA polymerase-3 subunit beta
MKLQRSALIEMLTDCIKAVNRRAAPVLSGVKLSVASQKKSSTIKMVCTDTEFTIAKSVDVSESLGDLECLVSAKDLFDILVNFTDKDVEIELDDKKLQIFDSKSKFVLPILNVDDFPNVDTVTGDLLLTATGEILSQISDGSFAATGDVNVPMVYGVALSFLASQNCIKVESTDRYTRAVSFPIPCNQIQKDVVMLIPHTHLATMLSLFATSEIVEIYHNTKMLCFSAKGIMVRASLLDANVVDWSSRLSRVTATTIELDNKEVQQTLRRASLVSKRAPGNAVKFMYDGTRLLVSSTGSDGSFFEQEVPVTVTPNAAFRFHVNYEAFLAVLMRADETIKIGFQNEKSPLLITRSDNWLGAVLPLAI